MTDLLPTHAASDAASADPSTRAGRIATRVVHCEITPDELRKTYRYALYPPRESS